MLRFEKTIYWLEKANSVLHLNQYLVKLLWVSWCVRWHGNLLKKEKNYIPRKALEFKVNSTKKLLHQRERERHQCLKSGSIPTSENGQIHLKPAAIWFTPALHFDWQSASSLLKPIFTLSSSTCSFHVLFGLPFSLWSSTSKSNALIKTWPCFLKAVEEDSKKDWQKVSDTWQAWSGDDWQKVSDTWQAWSGDDCTVLNRNIYRSKWRIGVYIISSWMTWILPPWLS